MKKGKNIKCENCKGEFYAPNWWLKKGAKYCSKECYWESKHDEPWNKGKKGLTRGNSGSFSHKKSVHSLSLSEYKYIHYKVRRLFGDPTECVHCGDTKSRLEWANMSGQYRFERSDWIQLCPGCHYKFDNVESRRLKNVTS